MVGPVNVALVRGELSDSRPGRLSSGERASGIHWMGGPVGFITSVDDMERRKILPLLGLETRPLDRTVLRH
jgi:hypothetical protein